VFNQESIFLCIMYGTCEWKACVFGIVKCGKHAPKCVIYRKGVCQTRMADVVDVVYVNIVT
jgi:hypothetical protein